MTRTLDIGCGGTRRGDVGMDLFPGGDPATVRHDLREIPWPFPDATFDRVYAFDVLEHLPWGEPEQLDHLPAVLREAHRILRPGGVLEVEVPHVANWTAYGIPTHRRQFNEWSFRYFVNGHTRRPDESTRAIGIFRSCHVWVEYRYPGHWHLREYVPPVYRITQALRLGLKSKVHAELVK